MKTLACALFLGSLGLVLVSGGLAEEPKRGKGKEFRDESKTGTVATTIDFQGALGLPFDSLRGLGARIEQARAGVDPVGLAGAANELAVAEKVSGKHAAIKSGELMKEAAEAAKRRYRADELKAVAMLVPEGKLRDDLQDAAARAEKRAGETTRGIPGTLTVFNNTPRTIAIYVNDRQVGWVDSNNQRSFYVGDDPYNNTKLFGRSGSTTWGPRYVSDPPSSGNYNWNLFMTNP